MGLDILVDKHLHLKYLLVSVHWMQLLVRTMLVGCLHFFLINQILDMLSYFVVYFFSDWDRVSDSLF